MKWAVFWNRFSSAVDSNKQLDSEQKLAYLREAIQDQEASPFMYHTSTSPNQYDEIVQLLKENYDQKRTFHQHHVLSIANATNLKTCSHEELSMFRDSMKHNMSCLEDSGYHNLGAVYTSIPTSKFPKTLTGQWLHYSRDQKGIPDVKHVFAFQQERIMSSPPSSVPVIKMEPKPENPRHNRASVHSVQSQPRDSCGSCGGDKHPTYICPTFKTTSLEAKATHVRSHNLLFNCLSPGHRIKECRSTGRRSRCGKKHHTILHRDTDSSPEVVSPPAEPQVQQTAVDAVIPAAHSEFFFPDDKHGHTGVTRTTATSSKSSPRQWSYHLTSDFQSRAATPVTQQSKAFNITGAQGVHTGSTQYSVTFNVKPINAKEPLFFMTASVVPTVTCNLPLQFLPGVRECGHLKDLPLPDPQFNKPGKIDLIIGCNALWHVIKFERGKEILSTQSESRQFSDGQSWALTNLHRAQPLSTRSGGACSSND